MPEELSHLPEPDELHDRLIDVSLRELLGGEAPPDLSQRILTAASAAKNPAPAALITAGGSHVNANQPSSSKSRFPWISIAIAACLLVGAAFLLFPAVQSSREQSTPVASRNNTKQIDLQKSEKGVDELRTVITEHTRASGEARDAGQLGDPSGDQQGQGQQDGEAGQLTLGVAVNSDAGAVTGVAPSASPTPTDNYGTYGGVPGLAAQGPARPSPEGSGQGQGGSQAGQASAESLSDLGSIASSDGTAPAFTRDGLGAGDRSGGGQQSEHSAGAAAPSDPLAQIAGNGAPPNTFAWHDQKTTLNASEAEDQAAPAAAGASVASIGSSNAEELQKQLAARYARSDLSRGSETDEDVQVVVNGFTVPALKVRQADPSGSGPGAGGDQYARIVDNPFRAVSAANTDNRLSTFSIDVDTASYANTRQFLMQSNMLPPPDAVRIEELVNYFDYGYSAPTGDVPFASNVEIAACPWAPEHRLVRVGIKGREMDRARRPMSNIVFLIDVSGSMNEPAKLPLLVEGMKMLTRELGENDRVAIVVYASSEGMALDSTRGDQQQTILDALGRLQAGGSTAGGAGIQLAYKVAEKNFIKDGVNRIILCTDGDFNVGVTSPAELQRLAEEKAKDTGVFLTVIGFGRGNLNDAMMEAVADHGNGNYHYVDNRREARKVLVEEMTGTLVTIAKDVKIQIEFNPAKVAGYRLIGYENRVLAAQDFNDDKKDAGEIGAGHTVTALYEIVPAGQAVNATGVDELKYGPKPAAGATPAATGAVAVDDLTQMNDELLTLKIRFKKPDGDTSEKLEFPISDNGQKFAAASQDFQFAASVAGFGMLLRGSQYKGDASFAGVLEIAESASRDRDPHGYRREFVEMVQRAKELSAQ